MDIVLEAGQSFNAPPACSRQLLAPLLYCHDSLLTSWARQLIRLVHRWMPDRSLVIVGDRAYAALDLPAAVRPVATVITRLRLDVRLFSPPPPRLPHQNGRPRLVGCRLPTLEQRRDDPATPWQTGTAPFWYGERHRPVELASQTAVWHHTRMAPVPIRWVLARDPRGKFQTQALLCTTGETPPEQILAWLIRRWQMEVAFHEVRAHDSLVVGIDCRMADLLCHAT